MMAVPEPFKHCMKLLSQGTELDMAAFLKFWAENEDVICSVDVRKLHGTYGFPNDIAFIPNCGYALLLLTECCSDHPFLAVARPTFHRVCKKEKKKI